MARDPHKLNDADIAIEFIKLHKEQSRNIRRKHNSIKADLPHGFTISITAMEGLIQDMKGKGMSTIYFFPAHRITDTFAIDPNDTIVICDMDPTFDQTGTQGDYYEHTNPYP